MSISGNGISTLNRALNCVGTSSSGNGLLTNGNAQNCFGTSTTGSQGLNANLGVPRCLLGEIERRADLIVPFGLAVGNVVPSGAATTFHQFSDPPAAKKFYRVPRQTPARAVISRGRQTARRRWRLALG